MTLVVLHYPAVLVLFGLCGLSTLWTARAGRGATVSFVLSGLLAAATVLLSLVFSVPLSEILLMLGVLLLILSLRGGKEGKQ